MTKSPTKPIDTNTNTRLFLRQVDRRNNGSVATKEQLASTIGTQFERRAQSNLPYSKKPTTTRSDTSDIFGDSTTAYTVTASPTHRYERNALSIQMSSKDTTMVGLKLHEVSEIPSLIPKNAITNNYRKQRLLQKGCPKLLRQAEKQAQELERSIRNHDRQSARLYSQIGSQHGTSERVKLSIMTTRSNAMR